MGNALQPLSHELFLMEWNAPMPHKWELFQKNGYPDWWYKLQAKKKKDSVGADANKGKVAIMSIEPHLSLIP